jgi:hypothetical protein
MNVIIAILGVFGAVATIISLSTVAMNGGVKAAIIALVVLLAVYSMARIPSKESEFEKNALKERMQKSASPPLHQKTFGSLDRQIS